MTAFSHIVFSRTDGVARLRLSAPGRRNAISEAMRDEILLALDAVHVDNSIRVLIIEGRDGDFSTGADLSEFGRSRSVYVGRAVRAERNLYRQLLLLRAVTIAAVTGFAVGGGLEVVLSCDIRIAHGSARLGLPEVRRGFIPGGGGTQVVFRRGSAAQRWDPLLTGRLLNAQEAWRVGWVHEVIDEPDALERRVVNLAREMAGLEQQAVGKVRCLVRSAAPFSAITSRIQQPYLSTDTIGSEPRPEGGTE